MPVVQQELADEVWTPCSVHVVVLSVLRSEWNKWPQLRLRPDPRLISDADPTNARENTQRTSLLSSVRGRLLREVPTDTQWFEVKHLRGRRFWQLHAINFGDWSSAQDRNEREKSRSENRYPGMDPRKRGSRSCGPTTGEAPLRSWRAITD
jgi:hypothetical protein